MYIHKIKKGVKARRPADRQGSHREATALLRLAAPAAALDDLAPRKKDQRRKEICKRKKDDSIKMYIIIAKLHLQINYYISSRVYRQLKQ